MSYEPKDVRIDLPRLGDESAALAESERAQLTEYKAQNARLESVITGLKQQVKALERDQNESLEHIRTISRERDQARVHLADLERWRGQAGPVVEVVREMQKRRDEFLRDDGRTAGLWRRVEECRGQLFAMPLPEPPKVTQ